MIFFRVIPIILIDNKECIKTFKYKKRKYLGDPINIIKIYNDLGVDEIIVINLVKDNIDFEYFKSLSEESFVPLSFGGSIKNLDQIEKITSVGYEKVLLNSAFYNNFDFFKKAIAEFGSSTISLAINLKKNIFGKYFLFDHLNSKIIKNLDLHKCCELLKQINPGEVIFNFVDREGTRDGYDMKTINEILDKNINKNLVINGGAKNFEDILSLKNKNLSGAAASSLFSFFGSDDAVLINYISEDQRKLLNLVKN